MTPTRPIMRYFGGKWKLAKWIISHFPPHRIYVEPFGGAASVLMQKPRSYAEIYNDLDSEVVNVFQVLRNPVQAIELERQLRLTPYSRQEFESAYLDTDDPIEKARRTIIRTGMGFGSNAIYKDFSSGFRSKKRNGTTPAHDWITYPDLITAYRDRLMGVVIESREAIDIIAQHDSDETLFYIDPPYLPKTRTRLRQYYAIEMDESDHCRLAMVLHNISGMVLLSGYDSELYENLYPDWEKIERPTFAQGARPRTEILWINDVASMSLPLFAQGKS